MVTVAATCRQRGRNVLEYLTSCFEADRRALVRDSSPDIRAACPDREGCVPGRSSWPSGEMPAVHAGRSGAEAAKRRRGGYPGAPVGPVVRAMQSTLPGKT